MECGASGDFKLDPRASLIYQLLMKNFLRRFSVLLVTVLCLSALQVSAAHASIEGTDGVLHFCFLTGAGCMLWAIPLCIAHDNYACVEGGKNCLGMGWELSCY